MFQLSIAALLLASASGLETSFQFKHHDNHELFEELRRVNGECPSITRLYELNHKSVKGWSLNVLEFSGNPGVHEPLEPEFKYVGNMHGDEVLGRELLLKLADELCRRFKAGDPEVQRLVNTTRIHILPAMNPDGWDIATRARDPENRSFPSLIRWWTQRDEPAGRGNANNVDLNRDFPNLNQEFHRNLNRGGDARLHHLFGGKIDRPLQPETRALIEWILSEPFVLSANFHGGALVANYPFDDTSDGTSRGYRASPDDALFRGLARVYAGNHAEMRFGKACRFGDDNFQESGGITNGAAWYSVSGGMQDFNYLASNDLEITVELGCVKYPPASDLPMEWKRNERALIEFMWRAHQGIKGFVIDASTKKPIQNAEISVISPGDVGASKRARFAVTTTKLGEFWRILLPGKHTIRANAVGYQAEEIEVTIPEFDKNREATRVTFELKQQERFHLAPSARGS